MVSNNNPEVKFKVKASFSGCPVSERARFNCSHALLLISVGQSYHEGDKFKATLDLINRRFEKCTILVGDILQRHNLQAQFNLDSNEAFSNAKLRGDEWLMRNKDAFNLLNINYHTIRWEYYLTHEDFKSKMDLIQKIFDTDNLFKMAITNSINEYMERGDTDRISRLNIKRDLCKKYLLEECAAMLLMTKQNYDFEVYPRKRNSAMQYIFESEIADKFKNKMLPVSLRFKRHVIRTSANRHQDIQDT